jgi:hypothetical protein
MMPKRLGFLSVNNFLIRTIQHFVVENISWHLGLLLAVLVELATVLADDLLDSNIQR